MKRSLPFAVLIGLALTNGAQGAAAGTGIAEAPPAPIKVLFLGDQGHHRPADRAAQITPVLAGRGIDVTYTEKLGDLNPATLARYDALLIYANITRDQPRPGKGTARLRRSRAADSYRSTARRIAF